MKEVGEHRGVRTWGEKVGDLFREKKRINSNIDMGEEGKERPYMGEDEVAGSNQGKKRPGRGWYVSRLSQ